MKAAIAAALSLAAFTYAFPASAEDLKFRGGIGVHPVSSGVDPSVPPDPNKNGNVNRNIVRGVQPPGQIWVIEDLKAEIDDGGRIRVDGRGLLLGGGNNVGTNANARVFATLLCGNAQHSTTAAGVPLEADGDFRIDDVLTPRPPAVCESPVLLIRNAANQAWFAAGILKR